IMSLPPQIRKLKNLTKLKMSGCGIAEISKEIGTLRNLKFADLSFNEISSVPSQIGDLPNLEELYLGGNQITAMPEAIKELRETLLILGLAATESSSGAYVNNPIKKENVNQIQEWLPNTKIIYIYN
ncbi:MAG: leucine-rich repeat domain-containing protein, partial [Ignavibacteria bacterium]